MPWHSVSRPSVESRESRDWLLRERWGLKAVEKMERMGCVAKAWEEAQEKRGRGGVGAWLAALPSSATLSVAKPPKSSAAACAWPLVLARTGFRGGARAAQCPEM